MKNGELRPVLADVYRRMQAISCLSSPSSEIHFIRQNLKRIMTTV